jgi:hypothetical protein
VKELKKQTNQKALNKITKGALAMILASAVVVPATNVFADEITSETAIIDLQADSSSNGDKGQTPSLLPGDFFYFSKILIEKIRLALTIDDVKEAKLIAEYGEERIREVEALFAEGNEEEAIETMKKAIDHIEIAEDHVTNVEEEASGEIAVDETELEQAKDIVSQNIIALTAAMEKVENPVAKAAIQKNIEKSYAKLAKKMEKREKKQQQKSTEFTSKESAATPDLVPNIETSALEVEGGVITPEVTLPVQQTVVQEKKSAKQEIQQQMKEARAIGKEKKTEMKQASKEMKQDSKGNNGKGN